MFNHFLTKRKKLTLRQYCVLFSSIFAVIAPYLIVWIGAVDRIDSFSDVSVSLLFIPAGYVFAIWGILYVGLLVYAWYQAFSASTQDKNFERIGWWSVGVGFMTGLWIMIAQLFNHRSTLIVMVILFVCLFMIMRQLAGQSFRLDDGYQFWLHRVLWSLYFGWISVALWANISVLYQYGFNNFGLSMDVFSAIIILCIGIWGIFWFRYFANNRRYASVLIRALVGVIVKNIMVGIGGYTVSAVCGSLFLFTLNVMLFSTKKIGRSSS